MVAHFCWFTGSSQFLYINQADIEYTWQHLQYITESIILYGHAVVNNSYESFTH